MLVIRFYRTGRKHQPSYKIVVADKRRAAGAGRFVEEVGFYNPVTKEKVLKQERAKHWISVGAKPSATVHNLFVKEGIVQDVKIPTHAKSKKKSGPGTETPTQPQPSPSA
ncbi:MAG: 30S ribosomal protein S16 [Candidatus Wildermuthbacteria bacterium]|nr:30S ribosomal protein S16 [Candidatus Wildermuthbacteria bacterium]